jgi:hypothetical protein
MSQGALFDYHGAVIAPRPTEQAKELARVESKQGAFILSWCSLRWECGDPTFRLADLENAVQANVGGTPGSAGRVMRDLKAKGHLDYTVERSASRYTLTEVRG